jgi:hypothetical protein
MIRFSLLMLFVFLIPVTGFSEIQKKVKVKILSINPSQTDHLETTIRFKLPEGVSAGDVIDASGMEVVEEKETNEVYVTQKVTLEPKEARTFEVFVRNVWVVTGEEFTAIREKSERSLEALEGTKFQSSAQLLYDKVRERLDIIEEEQDKEMTVKNGFAPRA